MLYFKRLIHHFSKSNNNETKKQEPQNNSLLNWFKANSLFKIQDVKKTQGKNIVENFNSKKIQFTD